MNMRRREILKGGIGLAGVLAAGQAPAYVKSLIGASNMTYGLKSIPSAEEYVYDGLIAMWDGIENAGWGEHNPSSTTWVDLVGSFFTSSTQSGSFSFIRDAAVFDGSVYINTNYRWVLPSLTVETVFDITALQTNMPIIDCTYNGGWAIKRENGNNGKPFFAARDNSSNSYKFIFLNWAAGNTYSYSFQASSNGLVGYSSGAKFSENAFSSVKRPDAFTLYLGCVTQNTSYKLKGARIKNLRLYSRALTADEVAHNYGIDKERFGL